jgi:hypothetical protein
MTVEQRLERLERELLRTKRRYRRIFVGACLGVGLWASLAAVGQTPGPGQTPETAAKEVRAKKFVLEDDSGVVRAVLGMDRAKEGPGLWLFKEKDKVAAFLRISPEGPLFSLTQDAQSSLHMKATVDEQSLTLSSGESRPYILLRTRPDGPSVNIRTGQAREGITLWAPTSPTGFQKDWSTIQLYDDQDKLRAALSIGQLGPHFGLLDANGKWRAYLSLIESGPGFHLYDENGLGRAALTLRKAVPSLTLSDENKKNRLTAGSPDYSLALFGPDGTAVWRPGK